MTEHWHQTINAEETKAFSSAFWKRHREDLESGQFWADRIKTLRGEPVERLSLAIENLPLPAAFREGAIATRALIREYRKTNKSYEDQLALLYWLAAVSSFSIPYSERLREPGYNVLEAIPGNILKSLPFSYAELGFAQLELLNKTDVKWLMESWGEPVSHSTLHRLHQKVWREYEDRLIWKREAEKRAFAEDMRALLTNEHRAPVSSETRKISNRKPDRSGEGIPLGTVIVVMLVGSACLIWWLLR